MSVEETIEGLTERFDSVQEDIIRDYGANEKMCHILHDDLGLEKTEPEDEEYDGMVQQLARHGYPAEKVPDIHSVEVTPEHRALHLWLHSIMEQAMANGYDVDSVIALFFTVGRRLGLKEASGDVTTHDLDAEFRDLLGHGFPE